MNKVLDYSQKKPYTVDILNVSSLAASSAMFLPRAGFAGVVSF